MTARAPLPAVLDAPRPGRVLIFAPHADDEVIGCGGAAALHVRQGDPVRVVVAYDGLAGDAGHSQDPEQYRETRRREARAGGAHLGIRDYAFWDYPEGHEPGPEQFAAACRRVAEEVRAFGPMTVYAPWVGEHHLDHHVLGRVVRAGLELADFPGHSVGYEVWTPLVAAWIVDVTPVHAQKVAALEEHRSQLELSQNPLRILGINAHRSIYLPATSEAGEAFCALGAPDAEDRRAVGLPPAAARARPDRPESAR